MVFKQIFRVAFIALIWKQYKALIISTFLLIVFLLLVSNLHDDYLTHSQLQNDATDAGVSFIYKWIAYAVGVGSYFIFHFLRGLRPSKQTLEEKAKEANIIAKTDSDDPFAAIRERKKLRSRADFLDGKE